MTIKKSEFSILAYFIIRSFFVGITIYNLLLTTNQDSWISIILGFILGFIPLLIYYFLFNHDPKLNIIQLINKFFGNTLGKIINIILIIFVLIQTIFTFFSASNFIGSQYLYHTPPIAIGILLIFPIIYAVNKGISTISKTGIILFYFSLSAFILTLLSLVFKVQLNYLTPVFEYGLPPIIKGALINLSYNIIPLFVLLSISKNQIEDNFKLKRSFLSVYTWTYLTLLAVILVVITIMGSKLANLYQYPEFHILKSINVGNFFQRVESVLSIQWLFDLTMAIILYLYYIKTSIVQTFKINEKIAPFIAVILSAILLIAITFILKDISFVTTILTKYYYFNFIILIILLLTLIYIKIKKNKV